MKNTGIRKLWIMPLSLLLTLGLGLAQESGGTMMNDAMMDMMSGMTFGDLDTDGNGAISEEEFDAMMSGMMDMMGETGGTMMGETGGTMMDGAMMNDAMMGMMMGMSFADFDTDGSGDLSEDEFAAMQTNMMSMMDRAMMGMSFGDADTNADGSIDEQEFETMRTGMMDMGMDDAIMGMMIGHELWQTSTPTATALSAKKSSTP